MSKLQDLISGREKLRKYDELKAALDYYKSIDLNLPINFGIDNNIKVKDVSPFVIEVIISALEAEIAKLDEE